MILLAGQSNMVGMCDISKMAVNLRRIPENVSIVEYKTRIRFAEPWFGPEITFAHEISNAFPDEQILIIKFAIGSSSLLAWAPDWSTKDAGLTNNENDGPLYMKLLKFIDAVTVNMDPQFIALMWMQGERDARLEYGEVYEESLLGLYDQLCEDLDRSDINFVIGRLSDFDMSNERYPHWTMVRDIQIKVADSNPRFAWIDTDDLNDGINRRGREIKDDLHMSGEGYVIMGKRFAEKSIELIKKHDLK